MQRDFCQQGHVQLGRFGGNAAMAKDMLFMATAGADMGRHVFNHAQDRHVQLVEHINAFARINQCHILRGGDDHGTIHLRLLGQGHLHITGAGRQIHDQHI